MMSGFSEWRDRLQFLLSLAGLFISGYLTYIKLFGLEAYCGGIGDCEAVQTSPYAELFGIPVAIYGIATYLALLVLLWAKRADWNEMGDLAEQGFFFITVVGVLFSAYLTYLELFVILAICPWCVGSAVVVTAMFLFSLSELVGFGDDDLEPEIIRGAN